MPYDVLKRPYDFPIFWTDAVERTVAAPGKWFIISARQTEKDLLPEMRRMRLLRDSYRVFPLAYPGITKALKLGRLAFRRSPSAPVTSPGGHALYSIEVCYRVGQDQTALLKKILEEHR